MHEPPINSSGWKLREIAAQPYFRTVTKMEVALKFVINSVSKGNISENQLKFSVFTTYQRLVTLHKSKACCKVKSKRDHYYQLGHAESEESLKMQMVQRLGNRTTFKLAKFFKKPFQSSQGCPQGMYLQFYGSKDSTLEFTLVSTQTLFKDLDFLDM